jgi:plastocyanin
VSRTSFVLACLVSALALFATAAEAGVVEAVALDECDPATFNAALGAGECLNVAAGASVTLNALIASVASGHPSSSWLYSPSEVTIKKRDVVVATNEGGEVHTFTEVRQFGGGFVPLLNPPGSTTVPECQNGFANPAVASTRLLQGSRREVSSLSEGTHLFQCCIHPWMHFEVEVK